MSSADELKYKLEETWKRALPLMLRRLDAIERARTAAEGRVLSDTLRNEAAQEAHKLAGSLGVFGRQSGSESALEVEQILSLEGPLGANEIARFDEHLQRLIRDVKGT